MSTRSETYGRLFVFGTWAVVLIVNASNHQFDTENALFLMDENG